MTTLRSARDIRKNDKIIAIMGPTGSGKSNLIDTLTQKTKWSGDSLNSVTQKVRAVRIPAKDIVLVDTPGFDDTTRSDLEVLRMIAEWLKQTYEDHFKLTGILYLHRISDNRMSGSPHRNLRMLGRLCGSEPAERLVFVTTMWDRTTKNRGDDREKDLRAHYFKPMLDLGAHDARFTNTPESAWDIISLLLERLAEKKPTLIQEEMVDTRRELIETEAAREVQSDLQKLLTAHKQTIEALSREAEKADNQTMLAQLNKERADIQKQLEKTYKETQSLKIPLTRRLKIFFASKPKQRGIKLGAN